MSGAAPQTQRWTALATRVLAPNAGPMTLDGTNSFVLRAPGADTAVVVDPGPEEAAHLELLAAHARVELVLLTHHHADHSESIHTFASMTGAPVRAADPRLCVGAGPLEDGAEITVAGCRIRTVVTPGHTADSVCFHLPDDAAFSGEPMPAGSILTGDTILGRGTTIIAEDGSLTDYLISLERLRALGAAQVHPAHGPALPDLVAICDAYLAHRRERLAEVEAALASLGVRAATDDETVARVADVVYPQVDARIRFAAEASTRAQLEHLARPGG